MIKKLRRKFVLVNMILVSSILVFVFIALCLSTHSRLRLDTIRAAQESLKGGMKQGGFRPEIGHRGGKMGGDMIQNIPTFSVRLSADGEILYADYEQVQISEEAVTQAVSEALLTNRSQGKISELGLRFVSEKLSDTSLTIAFADMSAESNGMRRLILNSLIIGVIGLIALFFVSLILANLAVKPVERAWIAQQQFIADASHELKTPLTVIMANTGILAAHPNTQVSSHMQWITNTQEEATRMKGLVENMLELAKGDVPQENLIFAKMNLSDIVTNSLLSFEPVAFEKNVSLTSETEANIEMQGNAERIERLVAILLDNAIKYAGDNGSVTVRLTYNGTHRTLSVSNTGQTIPAKHLDKVFDRFYREDKSRHADDEGSFGLGLAIARQIVTEHGGKIWAESNPQTGTVFTVQFSATMRRLTS
jgi:signal transduction histidine kinase